MRTWTSLAKEAARDAASGSLGAWIDERGSVVVVHEQRPSSYDARPPFATRVLVRAVAGGITFGLRVAARALRVAQMLLVRR